MKVHLLSECGGLTCGGTRYDETRATKRIGEVTCLACRKTCATGWDGYGSSSGKNRKVHFTGTGVLTECGKRISGLFDATYEHADTTCKVCRRSEFFQSTEAKARESDKGVKPPLKEAIHIVQVANLKKSRFAC